MLSAARAGFSACAARACWCPVSATCLAKQTGAATVRSWPSHSSAATTTAAASFPAGIITAISRNTAFLNHQLRAASSNSITTAFVDPKQLPDFTFQQCAQEVLLCATPSTSSAQRKAAIAKLEACQQQVGQSWWMLVECGVWDDAAPPPAGPAGTPARAVLCFSPGTGARDFDARAFVLDSNGLPTGEQYVDSRGRQSVTAFEGRTSKKPAKKYRISCIVMINGQQAKVSARGKLLVQHFLVDKFGEASVHRRPIAPLAPAAGGAAGGAGSSRRRRQRKPGGDGAAAA